MITIYSEHDFGNATVLVLAGDDSSGESQNVILSRVHAAISRDKANIILDIGNCQRVGSDFIGILAEAHFVAVQYNTRMILANPSDKISKIIERTGLGHIFTITGSVDAARALVNTP